jgi:hypothetical protein
MAFTALKGEGQLRNLPRYYHKLVMQYQNASNYSSIITNEFLISAVIFGSHFFLQKETRRQTKFSVSSKISNDEQVVKMNRDL